MFWRTEERFILFFANQARIRVYAYKKEEKKSLLSPSSQIVMIEVVLNDRLGKKIRVKCNEDDTIGDLKKLVAAQTGTRPEKIRCVVTNSFPNSSKFVVVVFSSSCS